MSARALLVRGMLAGVAAGLVALVFARLVGEGPVNQAIAFEYAHTPAGMDDPEPVSRAVQSTLGLAVAVLVYGTALGGIFGLAFAFAYGRLGHLSARATAVLVAGIGFVAVYLVPFLTYPANPPAVGNPETIGRRTSLYFLMLLVSVAAALGAVLVGRQLAGQWGAWNAALAALGGFVVVVAVAAAVMPGVNEVPADFSATVLWRFRLASLGTQLALWTTLGLLFGALTERAVRRGARAVAASTAG
jgi:putative cobalt transporter subunit CbtA